MIFVTYGTQPHNFEYLGNVVNEIASKHQVVVQIGESNNNIIRGNTKVYKYMDNFDDFVLGCDILITHGGVGSIMGGLKQGKKVIAIPRLGDKHEHVDNHQTEITKKLGDDGYIYNMSRDEDINSVIRHVENTAFKTYKSNTNNFVSNIEKILRGDSND